MSNLQLPEEQQRLQHAEVRTRGHTERTHTRVAADVWQKGPRFLPRDVSPVQWLFQAGPSQVGVQGGEDQLEGVRRPPTLDRELRGRFIRELARGETESKRERRRIAQVERNGEEKIIECRSAKFASKSGRPQKSDGRFHRKEREEEPVLQQKRKITQPRQRSFPESRPQSWKKPEPEKRKLPIEKRTKLRGPEMERSQLITWWNCAGGVVSKLNLIKHYIDKNKPDALFVFESNIKINKVYSHLNIKGYELFVSGNDISRTACYVKIDSGIKFKSGGNGNEVITLESEKELIIGLYRPFKVETGLNLMIQFDRLLEHLDNQLLINVKRDIIIAGDINLDYLRVGDPTYSNAKMLDKLGIWSAKWGLSQLISDKTRHRSVTKADGSIRVEESLIDHLYATEKLLPKLYDMGASDHHAITLTTSSKPVSIHTNIKIFRRDWRSYNKHNVHAIIKSKEMSERIDSIKELNDAESLNREITSIQDLILRVLAPLRAFRTRDEKQIINSEVEALKKRRNRKFIMYKKTGNSGYLREAKNLSKKLKKELNKVEKNVIQRKAESKDPKVFWNTVKELRNGKCQKETMKLKMDDGTMVIDPNEIANMFGSFFVDKVEKLSQQAQPEEAPKPDWSTTGSIEICARDVELAGKTLKSKKSAGLDGIPMCLVKDTTPFLANLYAKLFNCAAREGMPPAWKLARVVPLHKKGDKLTTSNFRPISNLSSMSKFYEKILLQKINQEGSFDGDHQHGFRPHHSTTTAILDLQRIVSGNLDNNLQNLVYSVDLSAAFDMLRKDTFNDITRDCLSPEIRKAIYDFLSDRRCVVDVDGTTSREFEIKLGCVQGSVLGPKLFNLYTKNIPKYLTNNAQITTYADDAYVVVSHPEGDSSTLESMTENCLQHHITYLRHLGMIVNQSKTEFIHIHRSSSPLVNIHTQDTMKVLGVNLDHKLTWSTHIARTINKMNSLTGALKFIRNRLTKNQFLQVLTSQYYSTCFYASPAWLGWHTRRMDVRKLNSLHYRLLRTVVRDWKQEISRSKLDEIGRVGPETWAKYSTASTVVKIIRDDHPTRLRDHLKESMYHEERSGRVKFFDQSRLKQGRQAVGNRLKLIFDEINTKITFKESNDSLRLLLKKCFNFPNIPNRDHISDRQGLRSHHNARSGRSKMQNTATLTITMRP
jgi:hypothetical protein